MAESDLGHVVPPVKLPAQVWRCSMLLMDTLAAVWEIVQRCWTTERPTRIQITIHVGAVRYGALSAELVEVAPLRLVEKPLDHAQRDGVASSQRIPAATAVAPDRSRRR